MALYTEWSNAHFIVAMDCTVSINARNNSKDAVLWERRATEVYLIAAQKFLSEVTGLSSRNLDHSVRVIKLRTVDRCKYL